MGAVHRSDRREAGQAGRTNQSGRSAAAAPTSRSRGEPCQCAMPWCSYVDHTVVNCVFALEWTPVTNKQATKDVHKKDSNGDDGTVRDGEEDDSLIQQSWVVKLHPDSGQVRFAAGDHEIPGSNRRRF